MTQLLLLLLLLSSSSIDFSLANAPQCGLHHSSGADEANRVAVRSKIWAGEALRHGEFPWLVSLIIFDKKDESSLSRREYRCTATILDEWNVMTAAHCLTASITNRQIVTKNKIKMYEADIAAAKVATVVLNEYDISMTEPTDIKKWIAKVFFPINYFGNKDLGAKYGNHFMLDMAILKLETSIKFDSKAMPICLPNCGKRECQNYKHCIATGWGDTEADPNTGTSYNIPRKVKMRYYNDEKCYSEMNKVQAANTGNVNSATMPTFPGRDWSYLCAVGNDTSICVGDSGGPLVCTHDGDHYEIVGVAHATTTLKGFAVGRDMCEENAKKNYPSIYTKIGIARPWIVAIKTMESSLIADSNSPSLMPTESGEGSNEKGTSDRDDGTTPVNADKADEADKLGENSADSACITAGSSVLSLVFFAFFF